MTVTEPFLGPRVLGGHRVVEELAMADGGPAFRRPLQFGDPEQTHVLQAMNGGAPYCSECYDVLPGGGKPALGRCCRHYRCPGYYLPGGAMRVCLVLPRIS
ncbi:MAG TPA: hypothetical protein VMZ50_00755 [Phycisphaerae bacterium]|nr:hypothetical protein [Phycisphaerae bacterium]